MFFLFNKTLLRESKRLGLACMCASLPLAVSPKPLYAAGSEIWDTKLSIELKAGSNQEIGTLDVLAPLWQRPDRLIFADVRIVDSSGPGLESNIGLGFRKLEKDSKYFGGDWAWGVYGFFDRRKTSHDNYFSQFTAGAELFTENWALRSNVYAPERDSRLVATRDGSSGISGIGLNGTAVVFQQSAASILEAREYALPGADVEVGRRFGLGDKQEFWLYGGYFHFDRAQTPVIEGPKLRAEYRSYDVFNIAGSEISIGAEALHDDIRGTDEFITARLRIPLGKGSSGSQRHIFSNLERRMTDYVIRDKDIVSFAQDINQAVGTEGGPEFAPGSTGIVNTTPIVDPASGEALNVFIIDNAGGGDCTQASPCTFATVQADANYGAGDVIIVTDSAGVVVGNMDLTTGALGTANRQLVGGAATVSLAFSSGDSLAINGLGDRPTVNGTITLADDAIVRDLDITSSGSGVVASGISNATLDNIAVSGVGSNAFDFSNTAGSVTINNSSATNSTGAGLRLNGGLATFALNNVDISDTASGHSVDIQNTTGGSVTFDSNSIITNSGGTGIFVDNINSNIAFNDVNISNATSDGVTATNLGSATLAFNNGLNITTSNGRGLVASGGTVNVNDGVINTMGGEAVDLDGVNAGISFTSLTATNSSDTGVDLNNVTGSFVVSGATTVSNAANAGIDISGGSGTKTFGAVSVNRLGTGINIDGGSSTVEFGQTTIANPNTVAFSSIAVANTTGGAVAFTSAAHNIEQGTGSADAISLNNNAASFGFNGGSITTATTGANSAVGISGAQAGVSFGDAAGTTISQTGTGRLLNVDNVTGGNNILFSANGSLSATTAGNAGVNINNSVVNTTLANATLNNTSGDAVTVAGGSGQVNLSNVDINNASGDGVQVTNLAGTLQFQQGSSVSNATGNGLNINGGGGATAVQVFGTAATNDFSSLGGDAITVANSTGAVTISDADGTAITGEVVNTNNTGNVTITGGLTLAQVAGGRFINQTGTINVNNATLSNLVINGGNAGYTFTGSTLDNAATGTAVIDVSNTTGGSVIIGAGNTITADAAGIALANVDGDINLSGSTANLSGGAGISIGGASGGNLTFGNVALNATGLTNTGIDLSGATGTATFGDVDIINLGGVTGVSTAGSSGAINMASLDITGTGAASSKGVDITGSTGSLTVTNAGTIQNVVTAIDLDSLGTGTTNSSLSYQNGTLNAGVPVNTVGVTNGSYNFTGSTITKNNALSTATGFGGDFLFVDRTGGGTGTSTNRASIDFAETNSNAGDIIVLTDDGTGNIVATNGLQLKDNQQLIGFAAGPATVDFTGSNAQVLGSFQYQISDPTGLGAATLTNTGGTEVVTLANTNQVRDFSLSTFGAVDGIAGSGFTGVTINNISIANAIGNAFAFTNAMGTVTLTDSSATNSAGAGLRINGGNATLALNNFDVFDTVGRSLDIQATTGGSISFDANSAITNSGGSGILINNIGGDVTFNGGVSVTGATSNAVTATNLNSNTVNFNGSLGVTTTAGNAITASGGTLNIAGTGTTVSAVGGSALDLSSVTVGNGGGGALTFASLSSNGGANGIALTNVTATNGLTVTGVGTTGGSGGTIQNTTGVGISLTNTSDVSLANMIVSNTTGAGISGSTTTNLTFDNVTINDGAMSGDAISLTDATGTVNLLNSNITYDAAGVDGLDINNSALGAGILTLTVDNTSFSGDTTSSGLFNAIDIITSAGSTINATITGSSFTNTFASGIEIDVNGTGGGDTVTIGAVADGNTFTGVGGDQVELDARVNSTVTFDIRSNIFDGNGLSVDAGIELDTGDGATTTLNIIDNMITDIGDGLGSADEAITIFIGQTATANSRLDLTVSGNTINNNSDTGLLVDVFGQSDANVTVTNNTFGGNGGNDGLNVVTATAGTQTCLTATDNNFGTDRINLTENSGSLDVEADDVAALMAANNGVTVNPPTGAVGFVADCTIP